MEGRQTDKTQVLRKDTAGGLEFWILVCCSTRPRRWLVVLPSVCAVTAGSWRGHFGVAGQGPGLRRRVQALHVPSQEAEQSAGGRASALAALAVQQLHQEVDVAHGQAQDLVLAQLLLWRVRGDELPQFGEGAVDVVLAPALPGVGEDFPGHDGGPGKVQRTGRRREESKWKEDFSDQ